MKSETVVFSGNSLPKKEMFDPGGSATLFLVFAATPDREYLQRVLHGLKEIDPSAKIVGASSDEAIVPGKIVENGSVAVTALSFDDTTLKCESFSSCGDLKERVDTILCDDTKLLIAFSDASSVNGDLFLEALHDAAPDTPVIGGVAATPTFLDTFVIEDDEIIERGAVVASLNSEILKVYTDYSFGWQAAGRSFKITAANGNRIVSISGIPPADLFRHYLGRGVVEALPGIGSAFPLIIRRNDRMIARGIIGVDGDSFIVSGSVRVDDEVYIGYGNPHTILKESLIHKRILSEIPYPDAILNFYCEGRKLFLARSIVEYEEKLLSTLAPVSGMFTLGEFYGKGDSDLLNFSSTVAALKEGESSKRADVEFPKPPKLDQFELIAEGLFNFIDVRAEELKSLAYYDELTGLPNKHLFYDILEKAIAKVSHDNGMGALFLIDIDNFKDINDTAGHKEGDSVLRILAKRLEKGLEKNERLCRIGGDEFVIVAEEMSDEIQMESFAKSLLKKVKERVELGLRSYHLTASIGIALFSKENGDREEIMKQADIAMYHSKKLGKNRWSIYRESLGRNALERYRTEQELRSAIKYRQFILHYQPQYDMETGRVVSIEALVRWQHPERGVLFPDSFIEVAESSGLIVPLGELVLDMALEFAAGCADVKRVAVNISSVQFNDADFFPMVMRLLQKHGVSPQSLELEMTESVVMDDESETTELLFALAKEGIRLSIDDFGKGYSSLSYLKRMPIDTLKIDRSFVMDIPKNSSDAAIVRSMLAMARALELNVVAEGIETNDQVEFFKEEGDVVAQGYFYSRPLPPDEVKALLRCL